MVAQAERCTLERQVRSIRRILEKCLAPTPDHPRCFVPELLDLRLVIDAAAALRFVVDEYGVWSPQHPLPSLGHAQAVVDVVEVDRQGLVHPTGGVPGRPRGDEARARHRPHLVNGRQAREVSLVGRVMAGMCVGGDTAGAKAAFEAVQGGARKQIAGLWLAYLGTKGA